MLRGHTGLVLIRGARQLLTLRGSKTPRRGPELNELHIIPDGSLLIRDGVIDQLGPTRRIENLAQARRAMEINAAGRVVMPSFIDCHTHLISPPPGVSNSDHVDAARLTSSTTVKRLAATWLAQLQAMARHGTATVEIKLGCGMQDLTILKLLRTLIKLTGEPLEIVNTLLFRLPRPEDQGPTVAAEFTDWVCDELLPQLHTRRLIRFTDIAWDGISAHRNSFQRYLKTSRALGFGRKIHAEQSSTATAIAMACEHQAVSVDHLERATSADAPLIAESKAIATLLPCSSLHTGSGNAPARALVEAGIPLALGTNFHPKYSPTLNMQAAVALACLRLGLTPAEAISAATINGAHALGCASRTGSFELGKSADVAILNISDYRDLADHFGTNLVHTTMKRGVVIYREADVVGVRHDLPDSPSIH